MAIIRPVRCAETGKVWNTQTECAKEIGISLPHLHNKILFGEAIDGRHYINCNMVYRNNQTGEIHPLYVSK